MGTKTITSNNLVFIDTTDSRNLTVQLTANYATTQIYDPNTNTYFPSWDATNKLIIIPTIYVDSTSVNISNATVVWQRKDGTSSELTTLSTIASGGQQIVNNNLQVSQNVLSGSQIITYICSVQYDGLTASAQVTFNRADMGRDGNGVAIKGTALGVTAVSGTNYYTITQGSGVTSDAQLGDGWLYNGDLYICSVLNGSSTTDYFINAGRIQGPQGESAKNITLSATSQVFKVDKNNNVSPSSINITGTAVNTSISSWQYSVDGGNFSTSRPAGVTISGNTVRINGVSFTGKILSVKATDGTYSDIISIYKSIDGIDGGAGSDGEPAPIMFLTNENITFNANSQGQIGATSVSTNIVAYKGLTAVMPQVGSITGIVNGMTCALNTITGSREQTLTVNIANGSTLLGTNGYLTIPVTIPTYVQAESYISDITYYSDINGSTLATQPTSSNFSNGTYYKIDTTATSITTNLKLYWNKIINAADAYTVILSNESHIVACDKDGNANSGELGSTGKAVCDIIVYKGSTQLTATSGTSPSNGQFSYVIGTVVGGTAARSDNDTFYLNTATADSGYIPITIYLESNTSTATKRMSFTKSKVGATGIPGSPGSPGSPGTPGSPGVPASVVDITTSAFYFKSTTGKDGTFTPEYIYLYPRFQTVTYSNWQYSIDGGSTWANASGANGLTIGTYNSTPNSLRISRNSSLYSDTITSISFKCISSTTSIYDIVSIAKIYDVVDLEIGGRNLLLNSNTQNLNTTDYNCASYNLSTRVIPGETYTWSVNITPSNDKKGIGIYFGGGTYNAGAWVVDNPLTEKTYSRTFVATAEQAATTFVNVYCSNNQTTQGSTPVTGTCVVNWVKLEKGNKATDWTPAPEDQVFKTHIISEINQTTEQIKIRADRVIFEGATTVNRNFVIDNNGNVTVKGDVYATDLKVDKNIHIVDGGSPKSGIIWTANANQWWTQGKPYIWGDYANQTLTLGSGNCYLDLNSNGYTSMSYSNNGVLSCFKANQNVCFMSYGTHRIQIESGGISFDGQWLGDFVVEKGSSRGWIYQKWNSGIVECWTEYGFTANQWTAWGNVFESNTFYAEYPLGLFVSIPSLTVTDARGRDLGVIGFELYGDGSTSRTPNIYALRPNYGPIGGMVFAHIVAKGWWK